MTMLQCPALISYHFLGIQLDNPITMKMDLACLAHWGDTIPEQETKNRKWIF